MKLPRNLAGADLVRALSVLGYVKVRQTGSHLRLRSFLTGAEHYITVPNHRPLKVGTLNGILADVASFHGWTRNEVAEKIGLG